MALTLRIFTHFSLSSQLLLHPCMDLNETWQGCCTTSLGIYVGRWLMLIKFCRSSGSLNVCVTTLLPLWNKPIGDTCFTNMLCLVEDMGLMWPVWLNCKAIIIIDEYRLMVFVFANYNLGHKLWNRALHIFTRMLQMFTPAYLTCIWICCCRRWHVEQWPNPSSEFPRRQ